MVYKFADKKFTMHANKFPATHRESPTISGRITQANYYKIWKNIWGPDQVNMQSTKKHH